MDAETSAAHDPGVYFEMPDDEYHADPALGSSDIRKLAKNPSDYWWSSWMNPMRPPSKDTEATRRGTAVHTLVLYGEAAFDARYMRGAANTDDMTPAEKAANTKAANARAASRGLVSLPAQTYDNIAIAAAMIAKNPKLATALTGGLNEVSIFWLQTHADQVERQTGEVRSVKLPMPIRRKARVDCLKASKRLVRGIGDLKSLANKFDKPFDRACIDAVTNYRYDVQAKYYMDICANIPKLVADGCVYGDHDAALLKLIADATVQAWQFVFWQAEGAPITYSLILSPANPLLEIAAATIARADANYADYMQRFGPNEMWLLQEKPRELCVEDFPPWFAREG